MQKEQFSEWGGGERRSADHIFIQIYFRMHHFVVKFSKIFFASGARGHCPPNQNPADALDSASHIPSAADISTAVWFGAGNVMFIGPICLFYLRPYIFANNVTQKVWLDLDCNEN